MNKREKIQALLDERYGVQMRNDLLDKIDAVYSEQPTDPDITPEVQALIEAAIDYTRNNGVSGADGEALYRATQPFRTTDPDIPTEKDVGKPCIFDGKIMILDGVNHNSDFPYTASNGVSYHSCKRFYYIPLTRCDGERPEDWVDAEGGIVMLTDGTTATFKSDITPAWRLVAMYCPAHKLNGLPGWSHE